MPMLAFLICLLVLTASVLVLARSMRKPVVRPVYVSPQTRAEVRLWWTTEAVVPMSERREEYVAAPRCTRAACVASGIICSHEYAIRAALFPMSL